jgi:hypothetical protein
MANKIITIGDWNDTLPAAPSNCDNVKFQVNRVPEVPKISGYVKRADVAGTHYGTIIYDGSNNSLKYLGADGNWHTLPTNSTGAPVRPDYSGCSIFWNIPAGLPFPNLGTGGTLNLELFNNAIVSLREGIYGKCASLNQAASDYRGFIKTIGSSIGESNSLSVALWIKTVYRNDYAIIFAKNYYSNDAGSSPYFAWNIRYNSTSISTGAQYFAEVYTNSTTRNLYSTYLTDYLPYNIWSHIGFTYDATSGLFSLYKNGECITSNNYGAYPIDYGTHGSYVVGADYQFTPRQAFGTYEDIRVYSSALSAADFLALYQAGASRYASV